MFNKNKLSAAIVALVAGGSNYALAQENPIVEEVVVTGIRASAQASMDVKRDATGVVDAITSEDMGKFPDTNLAESLQRITGVSISRTNGEGSEVTVRGFGGEFNMITLNGRTMPTANVYGGGSGAGGTKGGSTRAFDFANIASENVSAVEVYKTGRASVATGGIGASINVKTARPLDNPGLQFSVGAKALHDTTNRTGDDVTPEVSGIVSWTDDSDKFGVGLSLSRQERHSGSTGVSENEWNIGRWDAANWQENNLFSFAPGVNLRTDAANLDAMRTGTNEAFPNGLTGVYNAPRDGQLYARPNDIRYVFSDMERTRTNAQLVLQFAPNENITTTLDYTFAQNEIFERRGESTSWLANGNSIDAVVFSNDEVATPIYIHETAGPRDQGFEQQLRQQENTLDSLGFNLEWQASDRLSLAFDLHKSSMESLPVGPGKAGEIAASIGAPVQTSHWLDFSGDLPLYNMNFDDSIRATGTRQDPRTPVFDRGNYRDGDDNEIQFPLWAETWEPALDGSGNPVIVNGVPQQTFSGGVTPATATPLFRGNNNGEFDAGDIGSQVVRVFYAAQKTDVTQAKIDGSLEFDNGRFDFGVERRVLEMTAQASDRYMAFGDWGIANVSDIPTNLFEFFNLSDFDDYDASRSFQYGFKGNAEDIGQSLIDNPLYAGRGNVLAYNPNFSLNDNIEEDITALYVQAKLEGSLGGLETNIMAGLRYETTDVTSTSDMLVPTYLQWQDNNDFQVIRQSDITAFRVKESYDNLLPSIDFDIKFSDDLVGRASYSKTIARAGFGSLASSASNFAAGGGSVYMGAQPTVNVGNPGLIPLESNNMDVSAEWYFADTSYVSLGFFEKRVNNFVGTEQTRRTLSEYGEIRDVTSGERVEAAAAALQTANIAIDDTSLFVMTALLDNNRAATEYVNAINAGAETRSAFEQQIAFTYDINLDDPASTDPETVWQVSRPVNNREAKLYGSEIAVQHFFGETGFGVAANYTIVRGDVKYNDNADPSETQFALLGLSDTANLVLMYENYGIQARLAYNWRDKYLNNASRGTARNPVYVEEYFQVDFNVSYEIPGVEGLNVSLEGLNITGENIRTHGRTKHMVEELYDLGARYALGVRYTF